MRIPRYIFFCLPLFLLISAPRFASAIDLEDGGYLRTTYSIDTYYESVYGNIGLSNLDIDSETGDNLHYSENLRLDFRQTLADDLILEGAFWGRHTSDKLLQRIQGEQWMVNEMRLRLTGDTFEIGLGDLSAFWSNYTFNNTLFGITALYRPTSWLTVSALAGANRDAGRDTYRRAFGGARIEARPIRGLTLGLTYVHTEITDLIYPTTTTDYENDVWSIDGRLSLMDDRLVFAGEWATSLYTADRRLPGSDGAWGNAGWAALSFVPLRNELEFLVAYEYVDPLFAAVMGTHSTDRETISAGVRYTSSEVLSATAYFRAFHDRLTDTSAAPYRTDTMDPGIAMTIKPFIYGAESYFKGLTIDLSASFTAEESDDTARTIANERFLSHLRVSNTHEALRWAFVYDAEWYNDRTIVDTDTLTNTVGAQIGYLWGRGRLEATGDLLFEMKFTRIDDHAAGRRLFNTATRLGAGLSMTLNPKGRYPTKGKINYEGIFSERQDTSDLWENRVELRLEQVFVRRGVLTGSLGLTYKIRDTASPAPEESYGEEVYGMFMRLEF